jgi:hypothetical protein
MEYPEQRQEDISLDRVITSDETWCYLYDPEIKRQSTECRSNNSPIPKKSRMSKSKIETKLVCFFDTRGLIYFGFVPEGTTVNQTRINDILFFEECTGRLTIQSPVILYASFV